MVWPASMHTVSCVCSFVDFILFHESIIIGRYLTQRQYLFLFLFFFQFLSVLHVCVVHNYSEVGCSKNSIILWFCVVFPGV